ncbi:MAG: PstS family phosphate ABC transporter substrate-binding protein [Bacteroidia bacterium]|nr:PstS family phosphate ABC transporter substrate-binding protein [Bacteroidia bacterium]
MKTRFLVVASLILFLSGCMQKPAEVSSPLLSHQGPVKIAGAFALYPLVTQWVAEYQKNHPGVEFEVLAKGSGIGLKDLIEGRIDLAMVSSETLSEFDSQLWIAPVARLGVVLITSASNPYFKQISERGLTRGELAMAFTDPSIQSWGEWFGKPGEDPIHCYIRSDSSGATDQLAKFLWQLPSDFVGRDVAGEEAMIKAVKEDPLALGYCNFVYAFDPHSQRFIDNLLVIPLNPERKGRGVDSFYDNVPQLQRAMWSGKYPHGLIRDLALVSKGRPSTTEMVEFLKWVLKDGQRLIAKEGYIEISSSEIRCRLESLSQ